MKRHPADEADRVAATLAANVAWLADQRLPFRIILHKRNNVSKQNPWGSTTVLVACGRGLKHR